mmetsp:Transcript_10326/g.16858  ORF Transcript_10326/g.16858 Transcript_10326/m.16858 type:complete len:288 (-) Transcript_10326:1616-2479(-)
MIQGLLRRCRWGAGPMGAVRSGVVRRGLCTSGNWTGDGAVATSSDWKNWEHGELVGVDPPRHFKGTGPERPSWVREDGEVLYGFHEFDLEKIEEQDAIGWTAAHVFASTNNCGGLLAYIDAHADIDIPDNREWTPLHLVSAQYPLKENRDAARLLIDLGDPMTDEQTVDGWTPLHLAILYGNYRVAKYLIDSDCDCNIEAQGWTPLMLCSAMKNGNENIAHAILDNNHLDMEETCPHGRLASYYCKLNGFDRLYERITELEDEFEDVSLDDLDTDNDSFDHDTKYKY